MQGNAAGYLFLAPVAVTSVYTVWWLRRGYAIREIRVSSQGELTPEFEYGIANLPQADEAAHEPDASPMAVPPESEESLEKRLLRIPALAPPDWSRGGFIERWIGGLLSERERTVLEQFYGGSPRFTRAWLATVLLAVCFAMLAFVYDRCAPPEEKRLCLTAIVLILAVAPVEAVACGARNHASQLLSVPACHPIFPLGLKETLSAIYKTLGLRAIFYLPIFGAVAAGELWDWRHRWLYAGLMALACAMQVALWYPLLARGRFGALSRSRFRWRRCLAMGLICVAALPNFPMLLVMHPVFLLVSLGWAPIALAAAYFACRQFDFLYFHTELDFAAPNALLPRNRNRQRR
jgi:hypothetical protein